MLAIYNKASICAFERPFDCGLKLQPDLKGIMARSRDWDELLYVWGEWRRKSGENMKELYEQLIELTNEAAQYNSMCSTFTIHVFCFSNKMHFPFQISLPPPSIGHSRSNRMASDRMWKTCGPKYCHCMN